MGSEKSKSLDYYLKPNKFIRDHAHEYVFITDFELSLVDTIEFQRLKDVRQLTCQHVYPGARHTRFEHSLGVVELTRQAIDALNLNGYISGKPFEHIDDQLKFNGTLAALLHDVGHCPFSHLGEREFDQDDVWQNLYADIEEKLLGTSLQQQIKPLDIREGEGRPAPSEKALKQMRKKYPGAIHEQLSCCIILENLYDSLAQVEENSRNLIYVDFELICRCILGLEYDTSLDVFACDQATYQQNRKKNVIVHLINSRAFDMDKLDYIIRDSRMTGIGTPVIDTNRLFRNMYLTDDYAIVFSSRAVPALQNMVDSRDELYMYVYNHHAVIFSDFMYTYIFRRLAHNARDFNILLQSAYREANPEDLSGQLALSSLSTDDEITNLGSVPKEYLFSPGSILDENRSDGDLTSLLNVVHLSLKRNGCGCDDQESLSKLSKSFVGFIDLTLSEILDDEALTEIVQRLLEHDENGEPDNLYNEMQVCLSKIRYTYELVDRYMRRDYLKPWWKTYSEFNLFINHNFPSDNVRRKLCDWICNGPDGTPEGDEFRSQLAKHVSYITHNPQVKSALCRPLNQGDLFVIERSAKFFDPKTLKELEIAQKTNEIIGDLGGAKYHLGDYYIKELPQIIPQKDYYSVYARNSFYVFSRRLKPDQGFTPGQVRYHYQLIEQIFVFVATELINRGSLSFQSWFGKDISLEDKHRHEKESQQELCSLFIEKSFWKKGSGIRASSDHE